MEKSGLKNMKFGKEKIKTFWYYYKWHLVVILLSLLLFGGLMVQCIARTDADIYIYWAGPVYFTPDAQKQVSEAFDVIIPDEYGKTIGMITTIIGEKTDVAQTDSEYKEPMDYIGIKETKEEFKYQMRLSHSVICILSPNCFEIACKDKETLCPLEDILDSLPAGATENGYGVLLSSLPFYKSNSILSFFPEDSVLCVKSPSVFRASDNYDAQINAFKAILDFKLSE